MDQYDLDVEKKDVIGGLDRLLVNVGMSIIALFPTHYYLIFKPKILCPMLLGEEEDGREGLKLGPGVTFILSILFLLTMGFLFKDVGATNVDPEAVKKGGSGLRAAISEGNIWRSIVLSLPFYFAALVTGVIFFLTHRMFGVAANLAQSISIGLYMVSTFLFLIAFIGIPGESLSGENAVLVFIAIYIFIKFLVIMPWQLFSFSRYAFGQNKGTAAAMAFASYILLFVAFFIVLLIFSQLSEQTLNVEDTPPAASTPSE